MKEMPFMKPAVFLVFFIVAAGLLGHHLLQRQSVAFQPPVQYSAVSNVPQMQVDVRKPMSESLTSLAQGSPPEISTSVILPSIEQSEPIPAPDFETAAGKEKSAVEIALVTDKPALALADRPAAGGASPSVMLTSETGSSVPAPISEGRPKPGEIIIPNLLEEVTVLAQQQASQAKVKKATQQRAKPATLSKASKQYLNRMNRLLDRELDN